MHAVPIGGIGTGEWHAVLQTYEAVVVEVESGGGIVWMEVVAVVGINRDRVGKDLAHNRVEDEEVDRDEV
jgi:hypothetical protein